MGPRGAGRNVRNARLLAPLFAWLAAPLLDADGLTVVARLAGAGPREERSTTYLTAERMRAAGERGDVFFDVKAGRLVVLDHVRRESYETTPAEIDEAMKRVDEQVRRTPLLRKSYGEVSAVTPRREGERRTVAGVACDEQVLAMDAALFLELCVAPSLRPPAGWTDLLRVDYARQGPAGRRIVALIDSMRALDGYPLLFEVETQARGRRYEIVLEALEARPGPIDAAVFEPPEGYAKVASPFTTMAR